MLSMPSGSLPSGKIWSVTRPLFFLRQNKEQKHIHLYNFASPLCILLSCRINVGSVFWINDHLITGFMCVAVPVNVHTNRFRRLYASFLDLIPFSGRHQLPRSVEFQNIPLCHIHAEVHIAFTWFIYGIQVNFGRVPLAFLCESSMKPRHALLLFTILTHLF